MKTPIENAIDELLDIRQQYFSQNQIATDTLDGILKVLTNHLEQEEYELKFAFTSGRDGVLHKDCEKWFESRFRDK